MFPTTVLLLIGNRTARACDDHRESDEAGSYIDHDTHRVDAGDKVYFAAERTGRGAIFSGGEAETTINR